MATNCCPTCGRKMAAAKTTKPITALPERAQLDAMYAARQLTKDAYFAECKRIAARDDLRFLLRVAGPLMPDALHVEALALQAELETRPSKTADAKAINALRDRYRASKASLVVRSEGDLPWLSSLNETFEYCNDDRSHGDDHLAEAARQLAEDCGRDADGHLVGGEHAALWFWRQANQLAEYTRALDAAGLDAYEAA